MFEQFIGTKPVEDRHRVDVAALEEYLQLRVRGIEQFKGGQSNPTYRITAADGRRLVLRRKPPGKLLPSAHAVEREYRVIQALHAGGFPVARPHALCEDDSVLGTALDRKSTRLNSSHLVISYAGFCLKKKKITTED